MRMNCIVHSRIRLSYHNNNTQHRRCALVPGWPCHHEAPAGGTTVLVPPPSPSSPNPPYHFCCSLAAYTPHHPPHHPIGLTQSYYIIGVNSCYYLISFKTILFTVTQYVIRTGQKYNASPHASPLFKIALGYTATNDPFIVLIGSQMHSRQAFNVASLRLPAAIGEQQYVKEVDKQWTM